MTNASSSPIEPTDFERLGLLLRSIVVPEALLFDMDGVLADVSGSYRAAILATASSFGVELELGEIAAAKAQGNANNDWALTQRLLAAHGVTASLADVTRRFEEWYQGTPDRPGLRSTETLLLAPERIAALAQRMPLAVVTGRPRKDAERFLEEHGVRAHFAALVAMEDAPLKPDPAPVRLALQKLGVTRAWLVGDTPDDLRAARSAGVLPIGIFPPGERDSAYGEALVESGAATVLTELGLLEELLS